MSKTSFPFKHLDEFLFKISTNFRNGPLYEEIQDKLSFLNDQQLKIFLKSITIICLLLPIILVLWLFIVNAQIKNRISTQKELISTIQKISQQQKKITLLGTQIISPKKLTSKSDFEKIVKSVLNSQQVNLDNVKVELFELSELNTTINKINAEIAFKNFSINHFTEVLTILTVQEKTNISELYVKKDQKAEKLSGSINLILYGKK